MTKDRDRKRRIRARMEKTGESYTTARRFFLTGPDDPRARLTPLEPAGTPDAARPSPEAATPARTRPARAPMTLRAAVEADDPESAMIALALDAAPDREAWALWAELDHLSDTVNATARKPRARLGQLLRALRDDLRFAVPDTYDTPALDHLHRVLETRRATPAAMAGLLIALGRRAGLTLHPVAYPGHFLVRAELDGETDDPVFIDPASLAPVRHADLVALAEDALSLTRADAERLLLPCDTRGLVARLLQNLERAYRARGEDGHLLVIASHRYELSGSLEDRLGRGLHLAQLGAYEAAHDDLAAYFEGRR